MKNKIFFIVGGGIIGIILIVSAFGYFATRPKTKPEKPKVVEVPSEEKTLTPLTQEEGGLPPLPSEKPPATETSTFEILATSTLGQKVKPLFDKEYAYGGLVYPYLYLYDPTEGILKYLNLDDKTYKELYRSFYLYEISVSPNRKRIVFRENNSWKILDLAFDVSKKINKQISDFAWKNEELYFFAFDENSGGGIYRLTDLEKESVLLSNLSLPEAKIEIFANSLLVWVSPFVSPSSPIFLLDLKNPKVFKIVFEEKKYPSLISNQDGKYLFFSYQEENNWVSKIYNQNLKEIKTFNWGTLKEKCSFEKLLVCGIPLNQNLKIDWWYKLKETSNDKIIIFDPEKKEEKEIILDGNYDILKPKLTPLGIIFWNRNDAKFYVVNLE